MKYLHSGYILFCDQAAHTENGRVDAKGLLDLFAVRSLPVKMNCTWVIGFGTAYERRQYKGTVTLTNPQGEVVFTKEFQANDPSDTYKGHYIFRPDITLDKEGLWTATVDLRTLKDESIWDLERKFWTMIENDVGKSK